MSCHTTGSCPFAGTDASDHVQNYGCLPTPENIINMRVLHSKTWACHAQPTKPCKGAIQQLKRLLLPHTVVDKTLLTEKSEWHLFINRGPQ